MFKFIKPLPIIVTLITTTGILIHDMHIDKAATVAIALPALVASTGALEKVISPNYHTHVERAEIPRSNTSVRSSLPNVRPPRDDDREYTQNEKLLFMGGGDAMRIWPSV